MSLKYLCPKCGFEIITRYLKPGDKLACPACANEHQVPSEAILTDEDSNVVKKTTAPVQQVALPDSMAGVPAVDVMREPSQWNAWSVVVFLLTYLAIIVACSCVIAFIVSFISAFAAKVSGVPLSESSHALSEKSEYIFSHIYSLLGLIVPLGLIYYSVVKRHHNNFFEALHLHKLPRVELRRYLLIGAFVGVAVAVLLGVILITPLGKFMPEHMPIEDELTRGFLRAILFSIFALLAPIPEEIMFRGYIFQGLAVSWGTKASAVVVTIAFILLHGPQVGFGAIPLLLLSIVAIVLIRVRIVTDSLAKCIVIHQIYNIILILITWMGILFFGTDHIIT